MIRRLRILLGVLMLLLASVGLGADGCPDSYMAEDTPNDYAPDDGVPAG